MNVRPAIRIVPVLSFPVFGLTENLTVPLPELLWPVTTTIHESLLVAVHAQCDDVTTAISAEGMPLAGASTLDGLREYEQIAASCVMENVLPAIVIVPVRSALVFVSTSY